MSKCALCMAEKRRCDWCKKNKPSDIEKVIEKGFIYLAEIEKNQITIINKLDKVLKRSSITRKK